MQNHLNLFAFVTNPTTGLLDFYCVNKNDQTE